MWKARLLWISTGDSGLVTDMGGFFEGGKGDVRVDLLQSSEQAAGQDNLPVVTAFRRVAVVGDVGAVGVVVAAGAEPVEAEFFKLVFRHRHRISSPMAFAYKLEVAVIT